MTKQAIRTFLETFGTPVSETPISQQDVWVDDHKCIKWDGIEYYIPENNSSYDDEDEMIYDHLVEKYHI